MSKPAHFRRASICATCAWCDAKHIIILDPPTVTIARRCVKYEFDFSGDAAEHFTCDEHWSRILDDDSTTHD
jgi:hypothetical protein